MSTQDSPPAATTVSSKFNFADADVTFQSADNVLFHVHRKNLEVCAEGFPPAEISTDGTIVELPETAATLELLFRFMYPERHPGLDTTPFEVLAPLAEAAEKYQVFPAMNICHIRLRDMVREHPVEVAVYASKHEYPYLVSEVAPMMIAMPPLEVIGMLPAHLVLPWIRYFQKWATVHNSALIPPGGSLSPHSSRHPAFGQPASCAWPYFVIYCLQRLGVGVQSLCSLSEVFDMTALADQWSLEGCCQSALATWRLEIDEKVAQIPKFSEFL
ncbi:hypothetical protein C8R46DRAFT_1062607 [Mycena filopes]|nr:hypothetical protein C8R46DRAFT_1062607 [Mycena filopes]